MRKKGKERDGDTAEDSSKRSDIHYKERFKMFLFIFNNNDFKKCKKTIGCNRAKD